MSGTFRLLSAEWYRLTRGRAALLAAIFLVSVSALRVLASHVALQADHAAAVQRALSHGREIPAAPEVPNAWAPFVDGWLAGLTVGTLLLLILAARTLASDFDSGLLRVGRTRSVSRPALVLGRALLGVPLAVAVAGLTAMGALLAAAGLFEFGPVMEEGYELVSGAEIGNELVRGVQATLPALFATWAFGLLVSSCSRSGTGAVSAALALYLGFDLFKEVLGTAQYWVFAAFTPSFVDKSYMKEVAGIARGFSDAGFAEQLYRQNLWLPWPEAALMVALAVWIVSRRAL